MLKSIALESRNGFLFFLPIKKAVNAPVKIINLDIGTASFGLKLRNRTNIGIRSPPPPIPPALESADPIIMKNAPIISVDVRGKKDLC